jgi:hypothetical protein
MQRYGMKKLLLALTVSACAVSPIGQDELEARVASASETGWERAGLGELGPRCYPERFQVTFPDEALFAKQCWPHTADDAWACFRWQWMDDFEGDAIYPQAVINPRAHPEDVEGLAIHELMHGFVACTLERPVGDPFDFDHTDIDVWGHDTGTAETFAREELSEP